MQQLINALMSALAALFKALRSAGPVAPEKPQETQDDPVVIPPSFPRSEASFHRNPSKTFDVAHIKKWEGLRLNAYQDVVGVWTIGYGHTGTAKPGMRITPQEAERLLRQDLAWAERAVANGVKVPISQPMFDAMVSLCFNVGAGAFSKSTLLRKLNAGDIEGAAREFKRWNKGGGRVIQGLVNRRADEERLFRSGM